MGWIYRKILLPVIFMLLRIPMRKALKQCNRLNKLDVSQLESYQLNKLKLILQCNGGFYSDEIINKVKKSRSISEALSFLPIMTKNSLRAWVANKERIRSEVVRETAGTTGSPMKFWYTKTQVARQLAVRAYCLKSLGIDYGEREARFWGRRENSVKSKLRDYLLNRRVFNFIDRDAETSAQSLVAYEPVYIYGYSSIVLAAAKYFDSSKIKPPKLKAIICTAESLQSFQQDYIERVFGCPVVMEYGCTEVDIIAFQCGRRHYHLVNPWLITEFEKGETIVTDLNQCIMPIVRYKVGDDVVYENFSGECGIGIRSGIIKKIVGRSLNQKIYLPDGSSKHAVVFAYIAEDLYKENPFFTRFLVVQVSLKKFIFYFESIEDFGKKEDPFVCQKITDLYKSYSGYLADFEIRYGLPNKKRDVSKFDYFYSELQGKELDEAVLV